jgi:hypothetical protein
MIIKIYLKIFLFLFKLVYGGGMAVMGYYAFENVENFTFI